jgi:hypothetical protein
MLNTILIRKYGIRGMSNDDLRNMIAYHSGNHRLVALCRRQLKFNALSGLGL